MDLRVNVWARVRVRVRGRVRDKDGVGVIGWTNGVNAGLKCELHR